MVAQALPAIEPGAPSWFQRWAASLPNFYAQRYPSAPVKLPVVTTTAALPDARSYSACMVFNTALGLPCVSDGTFWYPVTLGAHL
jgi:hypothetical protein